MNDSKMADVIDKAADIMDEQGFCTGSLQNLVGAVCIDGALALALGLDISMERISSVYVDTDLNHACGEILHHVDVKGWRPMQVTEIESPQGRPAHRLYIWNDGLPLYISDQMNKPAHHPDVLNEAKKIILKTMRKTAQRLRNETVQETDAETVPTD